MSGLSRPEPIVPPVWLAFGHEMFMYVRESLDSFPKLKLEIQNIIFIRRCLDLKLQTFVNK